jgi:hypothetical protein
MEIILFKILIHIYEKSKFLFGKCPNDVHIQAIYIFFAIITVFTLSQQYLHILKQFLHCSKFNLLQDIFQLQEIGVERV